MEELEKKSVGDYFTTATRAGLEFIPLIGAPAAELLSLIVTPPLERRRLEWMEDIGERLRILESERGLNLEDLRTNEKFLNVVMNAASQSYKTHEREKLDALKNAITNTASGDAPEDAICSLFLSYVERFTIWHIRILKLFSDPPKWYESQNRNLPQLEGGLSIILDDAYPQLKSQNQFVNFVWSDLKSAGLMSRDLGGMTSYRSMLQPSTSDWGNQFLKFISEQ